MCRRGQEEPRETSPDKLQNSSLAAHSAAVIAGSSMLHQRGYEIEVVGNYGAAVPRSGVGSGLWRLRISK